MANASKPKVSGYKSTLSPYVPLGLCSGLEKWVFGFELPLTDPLWVNDLWKVEKKNPQFIDFGKTGRL